MRSSAPGRTHRAVIAGYVLKLARESIPASQEAASEAIGVDRATVQSWESGRRPFSSVTVRQAAAVRLGLARQGAAANLLALLGPASEADHLLDAVIDLEPESADVSRHPLGFLVLDHTLTDLIAWALTGQRPDFLGPFVGQARRGPVASGPTLGLDERGAFFTNLRVVVDRLSGCPDDSLLLHRQACFLAGLDPSGEAAAWLSSTSRDRLRYRRFHSWTPAWPDARSVATSLANQGDPLPLRDFIARAHPDQTCELAGLNYSAYSVAPPCPAARPGASVPRPQCAQPLGTDGRPSWPRSRRSGHQRGSPATQRAPAR